MFRVLLTLIAVVAVLTACAGGTGAVTSATPPAQADLTVDAVGTAFDTTEITLVAGESTQLFFRNLDGQPHNIAIYTDDSATQPMFVGETITDDAVLYEIPALEAGTYYFRCDVHPDMEGTAVVSEEGA